MIKQNDITTIKRKVFELEKSINLLKESTERNNKDFWAYFSGLQKYIEENKGEK